MGTKHKNHKKTGKWTPERLAKWKRSRWGAKVPKNASQTPSSPNSEALADLKAIESTPETPNA